MSKNFNEVSPQEAIPDILTYIKGKVVPILRGSPGVGKSDVVRQIAENLNVKVIDLRLSQCDPTDLNGFPQVNGKRGSYLPMDTFPLEGDPVPSGYSGWLLFLDEITSATPAIQAAAYKIILDRMVGQHDLHEKCIIVAAGNKETDNAVVHAMSTALRSRLAHIDIRNPTVKEWSNWAIKKGLDHRVISFLNFKSDQLYNFDPDSQDQTFPCPRTWEFASRIMEQFPENNQVPTSIKRLLAGVVGTAAAAEFSAYLRLFGKLPTFSEIINDPVNAKLPDDPGSKFAVSGMMASNIFESTSDRKSIDSRIEKVITYVERMQTEYQVVSLKNITAQGNLRKVFNGPADIPKPLFDWTMANAKELFD